MSLRLSLALSQIALPEGPVALFGAPAGFDASALGPDITIIQPMQPDAGAWAGRGLPVEPAVPEGRRFAASIVLVPRAKAEARARIADALRVTDGPVLIDGMKVDGVESLLKETRRRAEVAGVVAKAHGKLFWLRGPLDFPDWAGGMARTEDGWVTAPGVFSADGVDPASAALADALPALKGVGADLGAGWGYLSARALQASDRIETLHLVEAHHAALDCARQNISDERAVFHWDDALQWSPPQALDFVLMNPPFHQSRAADVSLGRAFIQAASRALGRGGTLWMVANRHLPYETTLSETFGRLDEIEGSARFKLFCASRPLANRSGLG